MFRVIPIQSGKRQLIRLSLNSSIRTPTANGHVAAVHHEFDQKVAYPRIGSREIVGFGVNGQPQYFDLPATPLPSIRWSEDSAEIKALREKAKGDWSTLTIEEKKTCKHLVDHKFLYETLFLLSFCLKYTERISEAPMLRFAHRPANGSLLLVF